MNAVAGTKIREELFCTGFLAGGDKKFSVTIGIPAYNELGRIGCLLHQVLHQNSVQADKITVNTSGNPDETQDEVISIGKDHEAFSLSKIIDDNERAGKATAFNVILKACNSVLWFSWIEMLSFIRSVLKRVRRRVYCC